MKSFYSTIAIVVCVLFVSTSFLSAQQKFWKEKDISQVGSRVIKKDVPKEFKLFDINLDEFKRNVKEAPLRFSDKAGSKDFIISIPLPDGSFERFILVSSPVFEEGILNEYPGLQSYTGIGIDDSSAFLKMSISNEKGISGMIMSSQHSTVYFDPYTDDLETCIFYYRKDRSKNFLSDFECLTEDEGINPDKVNEYNQRRNTNDQLLRDYRLAISTTGEYAQYHGGTVADALAAMNVTMTRVNGVYEKDFAVTMTIIGNTADVVYTNPNTDPYTSNLNTQLKTTLFNEIGLANFDIGHLFDQGSSNGNAGCIGCVCSDANSGEKGSAFTSHITPEGDFFDIDYVAHEMGHQFGGNHTWTFNGSEGTGVQAEPGSGSTIMGYAGITGATDVQPHSDDYFHYYNINQVSSYIQNESCHAGTSLSSNTVPIADAGPDHTIPEMTAYVLKGTGTDPDGDPLTFCWEQTDVNPNVTYPDKDNPSGTTNFRSRPPSMSPNRYMPQLDDIVAGSLENTWETVSDVCRTLNFALVVRDNAIGGGQTDSDLMTVTVDCNTGPFVETSPNGGESWDTGTPETITWNVAGTDGGNVNCANVDILLSTDGGLTWPVTIASNVPNDGSHSIIVPEYPTTTARVMIICSDNIFFDISDDDFEIVSLLPQVYLTTSSSTISDEGTDCNTRFITHELVMSKLPDADTYVTIGFSGTATESIDFLNLSGLNHTFTAANWNIPVDIILEIEQDGEVENDENIIIEILSVSGSNAVVGNPGELVFTLTNDDFAPSSGGTSDYTIGTGSQTNGTVTPFDGYWEDERMQMIYPASELILAGMTAGEITDISFNISSLNSSIPYNGYTIKVGMTSDVEFSGTNFYSGLTNVYSASHTAISGWNAFTFNTPYTWDGTSSLVIETCFDNDAWTDDDLVTYDNVGYTSVIYRTVDNQIGCNLSSASTSSNNRVQTRFTVSSEVKIQAGINNGNGQSDVNLGPFQTIHLYDQITGNIMASITENSGHDYGCTQVFVENEGSSTSESAAGTDVWLMDKTFRVIPTTNNPVGSYDITLYYTGDEMQGWENNNGMGYTQSDIKLFKSTSNLGSASGSIEESIATVGAFGTSDWAITGTFTTGFSGIGAGGGESILPVSLLNFNAKKEDTNVSLAWRTLSEIDNSGFEVQHSENGQNWIQIGWVDSKQSHRTTKNYSFIHENPSDKINYYRLKQVDSDGSFEYTAIKTVSFDKNNGFTYFPNPVHNDLTIQIDRGIIDAKVTIISSIGQIMYEGNLNSSTQISVKHFPPGNYTIQILHEQGIESGRFVKQ